MRSSGESSNSHASHCRGYSIHHPFTTRTVAEQVAINISCFFGERFMLSRLIKGDVIKKTRLHNYNGKFLDPAGFMYLPHSIINTISLKLTGRRPEIPWLGYRAIKHLDGLIDKKWKILEFGSGMSTIWFARRCGFIVSIETDDAWFRTVAATLSKARIQNADYRLLSKAGFDAIEDYADSYFDFALVDGYRRDHAMRAAISKIKIGGYIYLDNSDLPYEEYQIARTMLLEVVGDSSRIRAFNDFYPT